MTAGEVIRGFDDRRHNRLSLEVKLECLCRLEAKIARDTGGEVPVCLSEKSELAAEGFGELYYLALCALLDFENADFERQSNDTSVFDGRYAEFMRACVRSRNSGGQIKVAAV